MIVDCILKCTDEADYKIRVEGKEYRFEFSAMFGPLFVGKHGRELDQRLIPASAFDAVTQWSKQGKRIGESGFCVWRPEDREILKHLGGRNYVVVGYEQQADRE